MRSEAALQNVSELDVQIRGFEDYLQEIELRLGTPIGTQMRCSQRDALLEFQYRIERVQMDKIDKLVGLFFARCSFLSLY
jgi:hypothetical protein